VFNAELQYYRLQYDPSLRSKQDQDNPDKKRQFEFAEKNFAPLYFIRSHPSDRRKVEMSFDLTCYQPQVSYFLDCRNPSFSISTTQFDGISPYGPHATRIESTPTPSNEPIEGNSKNDGGSSHAVLPSTSTSPIPLEKHVFQTIFLDNSPASSALWSKDEIDPEKAGPSPSHINAS
jgi:hypothetical protein